MILTLFGSKHLSGVLVVALFIFIIGFVFSFLGKQSYTRQKQIIGLFTFLFLFLEILKLTIITVQDGAFPLYQLPFHLCSLPLYVYPLLSLSKQQSKLRKFVSPSAFAIVLGAGLITLIIPTNILGAGESWFPLTDQLLPLISFTFHGLMILSSLILVTTGYYRPKIADIKYALSVTGILAIIAIVTNYFLNTDFMLLNYGFGNPINFLIQINYFVYFGAMVLLAIILSFTILGIASLLNGKNNK